MFFNHLHVQRIKTEVHTTDLSVAALCTVKISLLNVLYWKRRHIIVVCAPPQQSGTFYLYSWRTAMPTAGPCGYHSTTTVDWRVSSRFVQQSISVSSSRIRASELCVSPRKALCEWNCLVLSLEFVSFPGWVSSRARKALTCLFLVQFLWCFARCIS